MNCRDEVKSDCKKVTRTVIDKVCETVPEEKCETVQPELPASGRRLAGQVHLPRDRLPGARRDVAAQQPPDQPGQVTRRRESGVLQGQNGKCQHIPIDFR